MLRVFRIISLLEGCSYLLILCVTLDIISRDFVSVLGMGHGVLFIVYCVLTLITSYRQRWTLPVWIPILLAAIVPFAFLFVEAFLQRELHKYEGGK